MLGQLHIRPLAQFAARLRQRRSVEVPDFDPLDGGTTARALFLFEKPGPMTAVLGKRAGSGFVSRDNDDPTAEATFTFMQQAGIGRHLAVLWNLVPWWNGTRAIRAEEQREGLRACRDLLQLLTDLRIVVLVGARAGAARSEIESKFRLPTIVSAHPSPLVRASRPQIWEEIPRLWAQARTFF
jgi:hypothetical protein